MLVTLLGIVILVSPQLENVIISMLVTLFGIVILVRFTQFWYLQLIVYQIVVI